MRASRTRVANKNVDKFQSTEKTSLLQISDSKTTALSAKEF